MIATTCGYGLDGAFEALGRLWMPWRGKTFSRQAAEGVNLFTAGGRRAIRVVCPRYQGLGDDESGTSAFRFVTSVGESVTHPGLTVLRLDYRAVAENPTFPVRRVLDELVQVDDGQFLGPGPDVVGWPPAAGRVVLARSSLGLAQAGRPRACPQVMAASQLSNCVPDASSMTRKRWRSASPRRQGRCGIRASSRIAARYRTATVISPSRARWTSQTPPK